ncbi:hypothetical protein FOCC_FOCC004560, partial [Frankliniella occidentalis]
MPSDGRERAAAGGGGAGHPGRALQVPGRVRRPVRPRVRPAGPQVPDLRQQVRAAAVQLQEPDEMEDCEGRCLPYLLITTRRSLKPPREAHRPKRKHKKQQQKNQDPIRFGLQLTPTL